MPRDTQENYTLTESYHTIAKGHQLKRELFYCKHNATSPRWYFDQIIVGDYENKSNNYYISDVPDGDKHVIITFLCLIGLVGFTLNLIQLVYIIRRIRAKRKLAMDYFLISLTVGDLYRSGPSMAVAVYVWYEEFNWRSLEPISNSLCKLTTFGSLVARTIGLSSMCIIALARLLVIRWPMMVEKMKISSKVASAVQLTITWVLVIAISIPTTYYSNTNVWALTPNMTILDKHPGHYYPVYVEDNTSTPNSCADYARFCTVSVHDGDGSILETVYWWLNMIAFVIIPQFILLLSYTLIILTLVKRRKERKTVFNSSDAAFMALTNKRDREAIVSALLGGVYSVLSLPILLYSIFDPLPYHSLKIYDPVRTGLSTLEKLTVVTNPLIYTFFTPSFIRQEKMFCSNIFLKLGLGSQHSGKDASGSTSSTNVSTLKTNSTSR